MNAKSKSQELITIADQYPVIGTGGIINNLASGETLGFADLTKVTVPAGGGLSWAMEGIEGETTAKSLAGIILDQALVRSLYERSFEETGGQEPALCFSPDSITGVINREALSDGGEFPARIAAVGRPTGNCATCPLAQYGTKPRADGQPGRGQMCRQTRLLLFLLPGGTMPLLVSIPPTGLKAAKKYLVGLQSIGLEYWQAVTALELVADKNAEGIKFSRPVFRFVGAIPEANFEGIARYRENLKALLKVAA